MSKIVVFYDNSAFCDETIRSSRSKMNEKEIKKFLGDVQFININKRNFKKYIDTLINGIQTKGIVVERIYIWSELNNEINELFATLSKNSLNNIPIHVYDKNYKYDCLNRKLRLFNEILEIRKIALGKETVYLIDRYNATIKQESFYTVDLKHLILGINYFKTEKDAFEKLKADLTSHIKSLEKSLEREKDRLYNLLLKQ